MALRLPATLIFFHIGKTAGRTLGTIISRQFPEDAQLNASIGETRSALGLHRRDAIEAQVRALPAERLARLRFVRGHVPFGIHDLFAAPAQYITLVRDPMERVVSSFYYLRQQPQVLIHRRLETMTLDDYLESRLGLDPYDYQVRVLSGCPELDADWTEPRPLDLVEVTRHHLDRAKVNIVEHFLLAAPTERFEAALILLRHLFGWSLPDLFFIPENVTEGRPHRSALSAWTTARIRAHNRFDREMHRWVDRRFRQLTRSLGLPFRLEVALFSRLNRRFRASGMTEALRRQTSRTTALLDRLGCTVLNQGPRPPAGLQQRDRGSPTLSA